MSLRIVLAEDQVLVRECLKSFLESAGFAVVGESCDGADAVRKVQTLHPQIALFDIAMPTLNGIEAAREAIRHSPQTKIVLVTAYGSAEYIIEALRAGVAGYVLKTKAAYDLVQAIREVEQGNVYLSPGISRNVVQEMLNYNGTTPSELLSPRERQVLQLIAEGKTTKEIGVQLEITTKTAESYRTNIIQKLDIHDAVGLVRYAIRHGIVLP